MLHRQHLLGDVIVTHATISGTKLHRSSIKYIHAMHIVCYTGNNCWLKELEAFTEEFTLTSEIDNACGIDRISGEASCNEACRELIDEQVAAFGCWYEQCDVLSRKWAFLGRNHSTD